MRRVLNRDQSVTVTHRLLVANPISEQEYTDTLKRMECFCPEADFFEVYDKHGNPAKVSYAEEFLKEIKSKLGAD